MHHLTDDWLRTDDGYYLYYNIIELLWIVLRQRRHLGATLHLEHSDSTRLSFGRTGNAASHKATFTLAIIE